MILTADRPTVKMPAWPPFAAWPERVELAHRSGDASGYGSLVVAIRRGIERCGVAVDHAEMWSVMERMALRPDRTRSRADVEVGPGRFVRRWINDDDGSLARFGTRGRAYMGQYAYADADYDDPRTRDVYRLAVGLPEYARYDGARVRALYTMWESSELPKTERAWGPHLERADLVLVPAEHSRRVFLEAAPGANVRVVPLGLDRDAWPFLKRERRAGAPFVFLMVGDLSKRKGWTLAYRAFMQAFGDDPNVHLVLKTRGNSELAEWTWTPRRVPVWDASGYPVADAEGRAVYGLNREPVRYHIHNGDWSMPQRGDPNVRILRGEWSKRSLLRLYQAADCFLWPSLGEGWGYPPREAAATGLPVITCDHTGMPDAGEWAYTIPYEEDRVPALFRHWGGQCGWFPLPDVDALAERMRWVYEHRDAAAAFGALASQVVTRRSTTDAAADILTELAAVGG